MAQLFGFEIVRKKEAEEKAQPDRLVTFAPEIKDDGAVVVAEGGVFGTYLDLEGSARTESDLVAKYREQDSNLFEATSTCCGKCGHKHVKGTSCPKPFLSGKRHCRNRD